MFKEFDVQSSREGGPLARLSLSELTRQRIEAVTGMSILDIERAEVGEIDAAIEERIGKPLRVQPPRDQRLKSRGSVLLQRLRSREDIDSGLGRIG